MLMQRDNPEAAYRRISIDARIQSGRANEMVGICYEQVVSELGRAIRAHAAADPMRRSDALTRAHAAVMALEMGLDRTNPLAQALEHLFAAARETILSSVTGFDSSALAEVRDDFAEIGAAMLAAPA